LSRLIPESLRKHHFPELFGQRFRGQDVHRHTEQLQQFVPDRADVQQGGFRRGVDQYVEVALFGIVAMDDRAENPRITGTVRLHHPADGFTMRGQGQGGLHGM